MEITHQILDIDAYEAQGVLPATVIERLPIEHWLTRDLPIGISDTPTKEWGWTKTGEIVRIPLFPYLANGGARSTLAAFSTELAMRVLSMVTASFVVTRTHIVIGDPVRDMVHHDQNDGKSKPLQRLWLGFGFVVKEKDYG